MPPQYETLNICTTLILSCNLGSSLVKVAMMAWMTRVVRVLNTHDGQGGQGGQGGHNRQGCQGGHCQGGQPTYRP